jgi:splicing factor 3B subunit 1
MADKPARTHEDIEAQINAIQAKRASQPEDVPKEDDRVGLSDTGVLDQDIYGGKGKFDGYVTSIASKDDDEEDDESAPAKAGKLPSYTAPQAILKEAEKGGDDEEDPFAEHRIPTVASRQSEYQKRQGNRQISPARVDFFADGGKTPDAGGRGYAEIMREQELKGHEADYRKQMADRAKDGTLKAVDTNTNGAASKTAPKRRGRWDQQEEDVQPAKKPAASFFQAESAGGATDATPGRQAWGETPGRVAPGAETPGHDTAKGRMWDPTPAHATPGRDKSSETPGHTSGGATPSGASSRRNRWDETPRAEKDTGESVLVTSSPD